MPHLPGGATLPPMTTSELISYLESLNAVTFCHKRLQMPRPLLLKLMTASLSQFFWIQTMSCDSIFPETRPTNYNLRLRAHECKLPLKDDRNYVSRLFFKRICTCTRT